MLKNLFIKDFIIIDEINLDFENGFSAFTGETGAGKSILIDAIGYLCGDRIDSQTIRKGASKAILEAVFDISNNEVCKQILIDAGIDVDNNELIVTREIQENKNTIRLNHRISTLSLLKSCLQNEIDIHSQHDNQYLLNPLKHQMLLDTYINDNELINSVKNAYFVYKKLCDELTNTLNDSFNEQEIDYFKYQIDEINSANLVIGEEEELENKEREIKAFEKVYDKLTSSLAMIDQNDNSISNQLYDVLKLLNNSDVNDIENCYRRLNSTYQEILDINETLKEYLSKLNISEDQINQIQERLFLINKLKRKYGKSVDLIIETKHKLEKQVEIFNNKQDYINDMQIKIDMALNNYNEKANLLSEIRKNKAISLEAEIKAHLADLMLPYANFKVSFSNQSPSKTGNDQIEFLISLNPGETLKPLSKVASGGELSRLMLGLKTIFTKLQGINTIIFDEIDTGVSGQVATSIGQKMAFIGKYSQVFAVTHLAQVAACAKYHYFINKTQSTNYTSTSVSLLNYEDRINQLALISSGDTTKNTLSAAKELLEKNQALVNHG